MLEDGTGCIEGRKWSESSQASNGDAGTLSNNQEEPGEGTWVRLVGNLRAFGGKKSLNIYDLRPLDDYNELMYHFAACLLAHSYSTKGIYVIKLYFHFQVISYLLLLAVKISWFSLKVTPWKLSGLAF